VRIARILGPHRFRRLDIARQFRMLWKHRVRQSLRLPARQQPGLLRPVRQDIVNLNIDAEARSIDSSGFGA
jgi:hypothetical protein